MPITDDQLDNFRKHRSLIALERNDFDDQPLQAFILGIGEKLVVLRNIRDFGNDGLFILRKEDITHVTYRETDRAQKVMIEADGILDDSDFDCDLPLDSWAELLAALPKDEIIILEDERPPEEPLFFIGRIIAIEPLNVRGAATSPAQPTGKTSRGKSTPARSPPARSNPLTFAASSATSSAAGTSD